MPGRIAVAVSGAGSNLRALVAAARRGTVGGEVVLVVADRSCPAVEWARAEGLPARVVDGGPDEALRDALVGARPDVVVLAGYMRILGPATLAAFRGRILNTHPSLLPAFPGAHAVRDALEHGVAVTGATVHLVDEVLDGGPILLQEPVPVLAGDDETILHGRIKIQEHRLLPRAVALLLGGAVKVEGRHATIDAARAAETDPPARRALLSVSDKTGLAKLARRLVALGFELVSTGGTARALREAGLDVTDVAAVTGFPEMLDGRVKTLHPRIHGGLLADRRRTNHREALAAAAIAPFDLVVVNLYPFAEAARRDGISLDELVEEIDVGGPAMVRAAAKNHASVAIVTLPSDYAAVADELERDGGLGEATRRRLALAAFRSTAAYDGVIAAELGTRFDASGAGDAFPAELTLRLQRARELRYGENPHQRAALYTGAEDSGGPFAGGGDLRQGKALSYNNILDASAAAGLTRELGEPACVIVKHTNPCGVAVRESLVDAWEAALAADPVSAFGGVVAVNRPIDASLAERLVSIFLEVVVAPSVAEDAAPILASRENLRVLVDPDLADSPRPGLELRSAGGAILVTDADASDDHAGEWQVATSRAPTAAERRDLDLAWRIARHVKSNAIVLVLDRAVVGVGAGQTSRVDAARIAVGKAGERARGAACASDAFFPFADGVEVCAAAGVTAFAQPGGSVRDAEVIGAADASGATMLLTGIRHFRH